jgi:hypothetical protein
MSLVETASLQRRHWLALTAGLWLLPGRATVHERRELFGGPVDLLLDERSPPRAAVSVLRGLEAMNPQMERMEAWRRGHRQSVRLPQGARCSPRARSWA